MTSASKEPLPATAAVRQAPFTETESPSASSEARPARIRRRAPSPFASIDSTSPISCTIPVNITLPPSPLTQTGPDQQILADRLVGHRERTQPLRHAAGTLALEHGACLGRPDEKRRHEQPQLVDLLGVEQRSGQGRSALDQQVLDLAAPELVERGAQALATIAAGGDQHLGACPLERVAASGWSLGRADHQQ